MKYDAIVVGGGLSGLIAAAYLARSGHSVLICEKEKVCGGLVNTFERDGFVYDGGIRALENSGVLFPMLRHLGLDLELVKNHISIGIEDRVIRVESEADVAGYQDLLAGLYPQNRQEIEAIIAQIRVIMHYMEVQYGIDNPIFLDMKKDQAYMVRVILPWVFKYTLTVSKITALNEPVLDFLHRYTQNQSLLDIIAQHFFHGAPAFFALSYLKLYLDYYYPVGGTGKFVEKLVAFIEAHQGELRTQTEIVAVEPQGQKVTDSQGQTMEYGRLVWAADQKALYHAILPDHITDTRVKQAFVERRDLLADKTGNDSVFTLFLAVNLDKSYFTARASEHFFYTPRRTGQSTAGPIPTTGDRTQVEKWLEGFFTYTTYEISSPVMRDATLAPAGKTGLIVSALFDYRLTYAIEQAGWIEDFKTFAADHMINALDSSIYPGLKAAILESFSSTPLTMARLAGTTDGAITGWAFDNQPMPAESRLPRIMNAIRTSIPGILQAGQWTYSPSGLPISILTGKLAADQAIKELKSRKR